MSGGAVRVVAHIDLDAFYAQVEVKRDPTLRGLPLGVVQYNPHEQGGVKNVAPDEPRRCNGSNGSLIALSYEARAAGVKRGMRGDEARRACPTMQLVQVPTSHQKADISIYRDEGKKVIDCLLKRVAVVERASIDEAYMDLSSEAAALLAERGLAACVDAARGTHVAGVEQMPEATLSASQLRRGHAHGAKPQPAASEAGAAEPAATPPEQLSVAWLARDAGAWSHEEMLLVAGAALVRQVREDVRAVLGYTCSAGVAANKLLAKLATGLRKPDAQTLLPPASTAALLRDLPLARLRGLGGAFGAQVAAELNLQTVGELASLPLARLQAKFGQDRGTMVHELAHGRSDEAVKAREVPQSIGCSKNFRGALALHGTQAVHAWLRQLAAELEERTAEDKQLNARTPRLLTVSVGPATAPGFSASCPLRQGAAAMADDAAALVRRWAAAQPEAPVIVHLGLKASNFQLDVQGMRAITDFMAPASLGGAAAGGTASDAAEPATHAPRPAAHAPAAAPASKGMRRFFAASTQQPAADGAPPMSRCGRCGREVAAGRDADEHADWHFAADLARQEQRAGAPPPASKRSKTGPLDALLRRSHE